MKTSIKTIIIWLLLNTWVVGFMQLALYAQTTPMLKNADIYTITAVSMGFAFCEWLAISPMQRIGNTFLTPVQLNLSSFLFDSLSQPIANTFWLHVPTTIDDYAGLAIVLFGMVVSEYRLCG